MPTTKGAKQRERDETLDRACRAYLAGGSGRKAAKIAGMAHRTLAKLIASDAGKARLAELHGSEGGDLAKECRDCAREYLASVRADLKNPERAEKITTKDKAWIAAVMIDKAKILEAGPASTGDDTFEVSVRFGGARIGPGVSGQPTMDVAAAEVSVKGAGKP
jgi:hypothetical protein